MFTRTQSQHGDTCSDGKRSLSFCMETILTCSFRKKVKNKILGAVFFFFKFATYLYIYVHIQFFVLQSLSHKQTYNRRFAYVVRSILHTNTEFFNSYIVVNAACELYISMYIVLHCHALYAICML